VDRDRSIADFIPVPFWAVDVQLLADGAAFIAQWQAPDDHCDDQGRCLDQARAQQAAQRAPEADTGPARSSELGDQVGEFAGKVIRSALNQAASQLGRQLVRGLLGSLMGRKR